MVTITTRSAQWRRRMAGTASAVTLVLVTACASAPSIAGPGESTSPTASPTKTRTTEPVIDKAGSPSSDDVITLRAAWYGAEGRPQARVVDRFAEEVAAASAGTIHIDIAYGTGDSWQKFQDGEFDMLLSPTRSLDTMGVTTFDALSLPFVVSDDDQADRIAQSPIVDTMMGGLSAVDATGLLFAPVYEMHLAMQSDEPLRTLSQLKTGVRIAPPSDRVDQIYKALGATPSYDLNAGDWSDAINSGDVLASEFPTSLATILPTPYEMAANFAVYYEFVVLMVSNETLRRLDAAQVALLKAAGRVAQQRSITERVREADAFRDACAQGASLTAAPTTFIADVGRAVDDVILSTLEDATAKRLYDNLTSTAGARNSSWPDECKGGVVVRYEPPAPPSTSFPIGAYRLRGRTREQLLVSGVSREQALINSTEYIDIVFEHGTSTVRYHFTLTDTDRPPEDCSTGYSVNETGLLTVGPGCGWEGTYTWHAIDDGMALEQMPINDPALLVLNWDNSAIGLSAMVSVS